MLKKELLEIKDMTESLRDSFFGNREYQKFIIITRSRTGSNLLVSLLNAHTNIVAKGELFRRLEGKKSLEIWNKVFRKRPIDILYVGFKIFYYHPMDSNDREVWDIIKGDKNIKIIHLTRNNILKTVVSREIAGRTNIWTNKNKGMIPLSERQVTIEYEDLLEEIKLTENNQEIFKKEYSREGYIELIYEDLVKNKQSEMNRIFDFLGVPYEKVLSSYKKQNKEDLKDLILNFDELKEKLRDTQWSNMIEG